MASGKVCTKCGETKPLDGFHRNKARAGGRRPDCKECRREYSSRYHEENRDKRIDYMRRYHEENRDKEREYKRRYNEENRDKVRERNRRYREENREKVADGQRRYYEENREKVADGRRRYYEENRDELRERARRYHEENRDILNQKNKIRHAQYTRTSSLLASKKGTPYSSQEDALILADNGMTDYQKAIELGRTCKSLSTRLYKLRKTQAQ